MLFIFDIDGTIAVERQVHGLGRAQLKLKSMTFMEKEGKA